MNAKIIFTLILLIGSQIKAISFKDYYLEHHDTIDEQLVKGVLNLNDKSLSDLVGFDAEHVPHFRDLTELYLEKNDLKTLPESFTQLTKLQRLNVSNNQIEEIPKWISDLKELKSFHLADNKITELPNTLGKLSNLKTLVVSNNPLAGTTAHQKKQLGLPASVTLFFKTPKEEEAEKKLFIACQEDDVKSVQNWLNVLSTMPTPLKNTQDLSKIRDNYGLSILNWAGSVAVDKSIEGAVAAQKAK